jgi:Prealbumin-like fold domain/von Willebrand factor type A domain
MTPVAIDNSNCPYDCGHATVSLGPRGPIALLSIPGAIQLIRHSVAARAVALIAVIAATSATASASGANTVPRSGLAGSPDPVITVTAGGDRNGATSVAGLAGERFDFYAGRQGSPPSGGAPTASCVTGASGKCSVSVSTQSGGSGGNTLGYWIVQASVPGGWFASARLDVGKGGAELPTDYRQLFVANVRSDISVPIADTSNGATPTARGSVWAASRDNPALPDRCGLNVALLFDLSGSIGSNITQLRAAGKSFVKALTGTPSSVAVYTFASHAPASKPANSNMPLTSVATQASANTVTSKINGLTVESGNEAGTNWDQGLWQVASSSERYDVTLVLTDGNPTFYGPKASGPGSTTRFIEVENGMFSANALKAKSTNIIAVGIGKDLRSTNNLAAISGPVPNKDYFTTDFSALERLLTELAEKNCLGTVNVIKEVIPDTDPGDYAAAVPAPGWTFHASPSNVSPQTGVTGVDGAVSFSTPVDQRVTLTEEVQDGYEHVLAPNERNAICRTPGGLEVAVTDVPGSPGFEVDARKNLIITCIEYNQAVAQPNPAAVQVNKTWVIDGTTYAYPNQPPDFQSSLVLDPPPPDVSDPVWGTAYDGYHEGDEITIGEQNVHLPVGCTNTISGDLGQTAPLDAGLNTFSVTNTVTCLSKLTLVKQINNIYPGAPTVPVTSWTLTAKAPDGTAVVQGTSGVNGEVAADTTYVLSESHVPGYQQTVQEGSTPVDGATGSWDCEDQLGFQRFGLEVFDGADGTITLAPGADVVCTATNVPLPAKLTLVKELLRHSSGTKPTDWTLTATPAKADSSWSPTVSGVTGSHDVTGVSIPPGVDYTLSESGPPGYELTDLACVQTGTSTPVTLTDDKFVAGIDEDITCTFTNSEHAGPTPPPTPTPTPSPTSPVPPTPTPTPSPTSPVPPTPTPTPSPTSPVPPGPLPITGANLLALLGFASMLMLTGGATVIVTRRRRARGGRR